jgi:predicted hotdog family 3-hydroxylacyl-ACP dehydratase
MTPELMEQGAQRVEAHAAVLAAVQDKPSRVGVQPASAAW